MDRSRLTRALEATVAAGAIGACLATAHTAYNLGRLRTPSRRPPATAERVSGCEEPGTEHGTGKGASPWPRYWSLSGSGYVSGFGMAHSTYVWAAKATGYPEPPAATPAMQLLVAVNGAHLFGWSGWGCY